MSRGTVSPKSLLFRGLLRTGPSGLDFGGPLKGGDERDSVVVGGIALLELLSGGSGASVANPPLQRTTNLELERTRGIRLFN